MDAAHDPQSSKVMNPRPAARAIDAIVFYALLVVIALSAIPYGAVEPWWKSLFQCLVFALAGLYVIRKLLPLDEAPPRYSLSHYPLIWPILALIAFAFLQTIPARPAVSADVFQTRQFIVYIFALLALSWLLITHTTDEKRLRRLVDLVIAVGTISALFGLWRQASQQSPGFVLPHLLAGYGYAQFINSNHFAFLMEMALGLALGIAVCRGVTGKRLAAYLIAAVPMWVALVFANSRGGVLSMLCQVVFLAALFVSRQNQPDEDPARSAATAAKARLSGARLLVLRLVLVTTLLLGAVVTVVFVGGDPLTGRINSMSVELDRKTAETYTLRPNIWRATWELIKDHPVAGVGFGGYWIAITKYHRGSGETTPQEAHNDYLELLASGGVIGLAIGFWFALALVRTASRKLSKLRSLDAGKSGSFSRAVTLGALAGILTVAIHSLVDFGLHITINAVIFTVLVSIVCINVGSKKLSQIN